MWLWEVPSQRESEHTLVGLAQGRVTWGWNCLGAKIESLSHCQFTIFTYSRGPQQELGVVLGDHSLDWNPGLASVVKSLFFSIYCWVILSKLFSLSQPHLLSK